MRKARAQGCIEDLAGHGVRPTDIADAVGVAPSVVSLWKSSAKRAPTVEQLAKLEVLEAEHRAKAEAAEAERRAKAEREQQERKAALREQQERAQQEHAAREQAAREREERARLDLETHGPARLENYRRIIGYGYEENYAEELGKLVDQLVSIVGEAEAGEWTMHHGIPLRSAAGRLQQEIARAEARRHANGAADNNM